MGQNQPKESDVVMNAEKVQKIRTNATGNAKWDDLPEVDRANAKFQAGSAMVQNPKATGTGSKGNPGIPT